MNNIDPKVVKIASITIGVIISIIVIIAGFKILTGAFSRASEGQATNVAVSNIHGDLVTVSWQAAAGTQGVVTYGTSPTALNFFAPEPAGNQSTSHSVDLTLLTPNTTYYFVVKIGNYTTDQDGSPFRFDTTVEGGAQLTPTVYPTQSVVISPQPTAGPLTPLPTLPACNETDCDRIKAKLGLGCTTQDYFQCLRLLNVTPVTPP